jgi:hypothetical protein
MVRTVLRRPLSIRLGFLALAAIATAGALLLAFTDSGRVVGRIMSVLMALGFSAVCLAVAFRPKVVVTDDLVGIVNVLTRWSLPREAVREFIPGRWGAGRCLTHDDRSYPVTALAPSDSTDMLYPNVSATRGRAQRLNDALNDGTEPGRRVRR